MSGQVYREKRFYDGDILFYIDDLFVAGDVNIVGNDLERDPGLESSILISLFTDRRAEIEDELPENTRDRRGWWADTSDDKIGSKLWLLFRSSTTPDIPGRVETYIKESLQWMIDDGVAQQIIPTVIRDDDTVLMTIEIVQPDGLEKFYKYSLNWQAEIFKRG